MILNMIFISIACALGQVVRNRQSHKWVDYRQYVEFIKERIREKWRQQALYNAFW
jgi:hypothetical protein